MSEMQLISEGDASFDTVKEFFGKTQFFSDLADEDIANLVKWIRVYSAASGANIFTEGSVDALLCFIASGEVSIFKETSPSEFVKIADIHAGGTIGEMAIIDGRPLSASAIASKDTMVLVISRVDFDKLVKEDSELGIKLLWRIAQIISLRLRQTTGLLAEISFSQTS